MRKNILFEGITVYIYKKTKPSNYFQTNWMCEWNKTKPTTHPSFSSFSNGCWCSSSWMNPIGLTVRGATSRLSWDGYGFKKAENDCSNCVGLGWSGVKLNMNETWANTDQRKHDLPHVWLMQTFQVWGAMCDETVNYKVKYEFQWSRFIS